ncbi:MAG: MTH938/NDUFAF3 family protein [Gammaproteobacteria bacterium]|nr:MTH938/NDUFAF3 family protein [Gammaproteobacteria bacterium]
MKLHLERPRGYQVESLRDSGVVIAERLHTRSLLLFPDRLHEEWPVNDAALLALADLQTILERRPQVLLLGSGRRTVFPPPQVLGGLGEVGIGVEVMASAAAARTYNILLSDGRDVAAALILPC